MQRELLFEVLAEGREYRIYTNGRVEGFGEGASVVNHFPRLLIDHLQQAKRGKGLEERIGFRRSAVKG